MGFVSSVLGVLGFWIGVPVGIFVGFYLFIYSESEEVDDPVITPLSELDSSALPDLLHEIPLWMKKPDYERVDWLNKFVADMWPYLEKAICSTIRSTAEPIMAEYIGEYQIKAIEFSKVSLGTLPPTVHGIKVYETNENELVLEPVIKWAGNPNVVLVLRLLFLRITFQLVDLQIFASTRITLKPLVPTFPCFANIMVSLLEKPHVDFGLKILGGDIMSVPGLYGYVQETIKKQIALLCLWPRSLQIPILDPSMASVKKPVGILHVNVVRALKLRKMDFLGMSDPYVKLRLTGDRLPTKKTTIKMKNLNPEWNEKFKLVVKDPESQVLKLQVYDWDKVGGHDRLGVQAVPLTWLIPYKTKEFTLDLLKDTDVSDNKKRGQLVVELTFVPFKEDSSKFTSKFERIASKENEISFSSDSAIQGAGLLSVMIQGANDVEGELHNNPYALLLFKGEKKKTKMIPKSRHPHWNEEFEFMLEEPPVNDKIYVEVVSKWAKLRVLSKILSFLLKESLGFVEINLADVVHNGRINHKYHLSNSKNGQIHVDIRWKTI